MNMRQPLRSANPSVGQSKDCDSQMGQSSDSWAALGFGLWCPLGQALLVMLAIRLRVSAC